jgi:hypothetical protein
MPVLLAALGEKPASAIDNLDRAARLGFVRSVDEWSVMRGLGNQMVHEYVEDPIVLTAALQSGHACVPALVTAAENMLAEIERRGWA